jgi:hypothetical protein
MQNHGAPHAQCARDTTLRYVCGVCGGDGTAMHGMPSWNKGPCNVCGCSPARPGKRSCTVCSCTVHAAQTPLAFKSNRVRLLSVHQGRVATCSKGSCMTSARPSEQWLTHYPGASALHCVEGRSKQANPAWCPKGCVLHWLQPVLTTSQCSPWGAAL